MFNRKGLFGLFIVVLLILISLMILTQCNNNKEKNTLVRIGYTPLIYAQPTFAAMEMGFFKEVGIEPELIRFENSTQIVNAVIEGSLDFCAIAPVLSVFAAEEKINHDDSLFKIFYYNLDSKEHPISFLLVKSDSNIKELSDLKGKTVGVFPGNILSIISTKLLLAKYMDPDREVKFQDVGPQIQAQALESGQIDAMFSLEPFATIILEKGIAKILYTAPQLSVSAPLPGGTGFMSTKFVKEKPELAMKFDEAIQKAISYIRNNPSYAKEILTKYTPLDKSIALKVRQPEYQTTREMDGILLQKEYDALLRQGVLKRQMDVKNLIYKAQ
jgi:NitT/TauT family transport system substrate-binding protein